MAVPQKRKSSAKRDMRRAHHDKINAPNLGPCSNCGELTMPHRVCPACGSYGGRPVVEVNED